METWYYEVVSIEGDYANLRRSDIESNELKLVARALLPLEIEEGSRLIIFVQPTRGLDIGAIENIHRQILEERERGAAILLISLELEEIMALADTIGVLYRGELLKTESAEKMSTQEVGRYMMGVREA